MVQIRVSFDSPQRLGAITATDITVEADQLVLLNGGNAVLNVAAGAVRSLEGAAVGGWRDCGRGAPNTASRGRLRRTRS